jgi:hypothetical protein
MSYQSGSSSSVKPQRQSVREGDNLTLTEQEAVLLDDIEAATKRIFNQVGYSVNKRDSSILFLGVRTPDF